MARSRAVFAHQGITAPVVAHFHPGPVASNQIQPLLWLVVLRVRAGQIVAGFGGAVATVFEGALAADHDQSSGVGEVGGEGFDGEGVQAPALHAPVTALAVGKKGVSFKLSSPWACLRSLG